MLRLLMTTTRVQHLPQQARYQLANVIRSNLTMVLVPCFSPICHSAPSRDLKGLKITAPRYISCFFINKLVQVDLSNFWILDIDEALKK